MRKAWCYIRQSDNVGCFKSLRSPSTMEDWAEGWLLDEKRMAGDCNEYFLFLDKYNKIWYFQYEATISLVHPSNFLKF